MLAGRHREARGISTSPFNIINAKRVCEVEIFGLHCQKTGQGLPLAPPLPGRNFDLGLTGVHADGPAH